MICKTLKAHIYLKRAQRRQIKCWNWEIWLFLKTISSYRIWCRKTFSSLLHLLSEQNTVQGLLCRVWRFVMLQTFSEGLSGTRGGSCVSASGLYTASASFVAACIHGRRFLKCFWARAVTSTTESSLFSTQSRLRPEDHNQPVLVLGLVPHIQRFHLTLNNDIMDRRQWNPQIICSFTLRDILLNFLLYLSAEQWNHPHLHLRLTQPLWSSFYTQSCDSPVASYPDYLWVPPGVVFQHFTTFPAFCCHWPNFLETCC